MATLDFVGFINENVTSLTPAQKQVMLEDFVGEQGDPVPNLRQLANEIITTFIIERVRRTRRAKADIEGLALECE